MLPACRPELCRAARHGESPVLLVRLARLVRLVRLVQLGVGCGGREQTESEVSAEVTGVRHEWGLVDVLCRFGTFMLAVQIKYIGSHKFAERIFRAHRNRRGLALLPTAFT